MSIFEKYKSQVHRFSHFLKSKLSFLIDQWSFINKFLKKNGVENNIHMFIFQKHKSQEYRFSRSLKSNLRLSIDQWIFINKFLKS